MFWISGGFLLGEVRIPVSIGSLEVLLPCVCVEREIDHINSDRMNEG
jgi:hypothetical protein